ncbi:unnamed protein product [Rotaria sordida]|uniref:Uncharacterized protein n=1 Tax=Rotaria sordida TaxID=392033 RepID=A0A814ZUA8_9BILA|nr:unnamed protein product [Rotaria sordida]CAF3794527.1 unnamed protein product [Rotaria sordida]
MEYLYTLLLLISCISYIHAQKFTEESPYMVIRLMDVKIHEWKPDMLDRLEKVLDAELKYSDEKKGIQCRSIDFEQEAGYPRQDSRFLDLSVRGLCKDEKGKIHNIDKGLMTVAIERNVDAVEEVTSGTIYRVGNVQFYKRDRNKLNLIIIPISIGLTVLLFVITFVLRRLRRAQKHRHIVAELQKKKEANAKKALPTVANIDPHANEKQRLLQLDPNVVGNASDTLGSPKEFTNDQYTNTPRTNPSGGDYNREYKGPPITPTKESRTLNNNQNNDTSLQNQRSNRPDRERMHVPYENDARLLPSQSQPQYAQQYPDMIPMQEQQPRVVVRTVRDDGNQPPYYQKYEEPSTKFVPIPVQVERSGPHQRFASPPYHSDPYYRHTNA